MTHITGSKPDSWIKAWPEHQRKFIENFFHEHKSHMGATEMDREIAKLLGRPTQTIQKARTQLGLKFDKQSKPESTI